MKKLLIVNADDFGASDGVNRGVVRAHREGILTSASLMVRRPAAATACEMSRKFPSLGIGLHVDLGEWALRGAEWTALYEVVPMGDRRAVREEVRKQHATFCQLVGREPTHIDSHQHVHLDEPVRSVVEELAQELAVPLRRCRPDIRYCGDFYGQDPDGATRPDLITSAALMDILAGLPAGVTELCCHPAEGEDLDTMYSAERARELAALCDPDVRAAVSRLEIRLCSFEQRAIRQKAGPAQTRGDGIPIR